MKAELEIKEFLKAIYEFCTYCLPTGSMGVKSRCDE